MAVDETCTKEKKWGETLRENNTLTFWVSLKTGEETGGFAWWAAEGIGLNQAWQLLK